MKKKNWIVIYQRKGEDNPRQFSVPVTKRLAKDLFDVFDDAKYLVKIKRVRKIENGDDNGISKSIDK